MSIFTAAIDAVDYWLHGPDAARRRAMEQIAATAFEGDAFDPRSHETALERQERQQADREERERLALEYREEFARQHLMTFRRQCFDAMLKAGTIQMHNTPAYIEEWIDRMYDWLHPNGPGEPLIYQYPISLDRRNWFKPVVE